MSAAINSSIDLNEVLPDIIETLIDDFDYEEAIIALVNKTKTKFRVVATNGPKTRARRILKAFRNELNGTRINKGTNLWSNVVLNKKPKVINKILADEKTGSSLINLALHLFPRVKNLAVMPLIVEKNIVGVIQVLSCKKILSENLKFLKLFADQAAIAIRQARLYKEKKRQLLTLREANRKLQKKKRLLETLNRASLTCQKVTTPGAVFRTIGGELKKVGIGLTIYFLDKSKKYLVIKYATPKENILMEPFQRMGKAKNNGAKFRGLKLPLEKITDYKQILTSDKEQLFGGKRREDLMRTIFLNIPVFVDKKTGGLTSPVEQVLKEATQKKKRTVASPLTRGEEKIGLFVVYGRGISKTDVHILAVFAHQVSNTLQRLKTSHQIVTLNKELARRVEQRTKQLVEALHSKSQFVANASHELRTPLSIIQANWDLFNLLNKINGNGTSEDQEEISETIKGQINNLSHLIEDLTLLSREGGGVFKFERANFNLIDLIKRAVNKMKVLAQERNIIINAKIPSVLDFVGDEKMLKKMIENLISNAIKYGKDNGQVDISLKQEKNQIILNVVDDGLGIPEEDLSRIFEHFYRVDKARSRATGGAGLGLAICRWIAEAHQGKVKVKSNLGAGSKFSVCLPIVAD